MIVGNCRLRSSTMGRQNRRLIKRSRKMSRILVLPITLLLTVQVFAGTTEGVRAFKAENFDKALEELKPAAEAGDGEAAYFLGRMYARGYGVKENDELAVQLYKKSAQLGYAHGQAVTGHMYANGNGVQTNYIKSIEWYTRAAKQGHVEAQRNLALLYQEGPDGSEEMSLAYIKGKIEPVEIDYAKAAYWFRQAAEQGDAVSQNELCGLYYRGFGVPLDYRRAAYWCRVAAEEGNADAQHALHSILMWKWPHPRPVSAYAWALYAKAQGHPGGRVAWEGRDRFISDEIARRAQEVFFSGQWPRYPHFDDSEIERLRQRGEGEPRRIH